VRSLPHYHPPNTNKCTVRAVINETFRVFPPVHTMIRASGPRACAIPLPPSGIRGRAAPSPSDQDSGVSPPQAEKPLYMPPHTSISLVPILIHRRKDFWGPDADEFDPDRWIDARSERFLKNPLMFVPFNAGPRIVSPFLFLWFLADVRFPGVIVPRTELHAEPGVVLPCSASSDLFLF
jgi:hypothetical protein